MFGSLLVKQDGYVIKASLWACWLNKMIVLLKATDKVLKYFMRKVPIKVNQIQHHSLTILSDGSSCSEVWYTQPLHMPTANAYTTKPLCCSYKTHTGVGISMCFDESKTGNPSKLTSFPANTQ